MRRSLIVLALLALFACSQPESGPDRGGGSDDWTVEVPRTEELASSAVKISEEGPWTIRSTVSKSSTAKPGARRLLAAAGGVAEGSDSGGMPETEGDMEAGAPPPTGAPVDAPMEESHDDAGFEPSTDPAAPAVSKAIDGDKSGSPSPGNSNGGAPLRAGTTDDNEKFDEFVEFLIAWSDRQDTVGGYEMLDVRGRTFIRVVNGDGRPVPAARVTVVDEVADAVLLRGTTYGDGRVPFYPRVATTKAADETKTAVAATEVAGVAADYLVEVAFGEARQRVRWDGKTDLAVTVDVAEPIEEPVLLDVLFVIDTTGSMGDEIERVKQSLLGMTAKLRSLSREFDLRYSAVLYRDVGDDYVTKSHPFTGDIEAFAAALQTIRAAGGGDGPESLNQGLAEAVGRDDWRDGAAKVMFLIADAPPHMDYEGDVPYGRSLKAAVGKGIRIHSVAASGIDAVGSLVFRQVAQFTRGKFIFIEYGGNVAASGAAHGVKGAKKSNNLDDILFEQIRDEVARWGR